MVPCLILSKRNRETVWTGDRAHYTTELDIQNDDLEREIQHDRVNQQNGGF